MSAADPDNPQPTVGEASLYGRLVLPQVPRAQSLQDFSASSRTYGCCDRNCWHYKTLTGYPAATFQSLAMPFALLAETPFVGNAYHRSEEMRERAVAALRFWAGAQHRVGSVDEWYRNEHSYCATAFTTFAVSQALLILGEGVGELASVRSGVERATRWLASRFNPDVMNQNLAACAALWSAYKLLGRSELRACSVERWEKTLTHFDDEGWFCEYGGADPGYATLALDLVACLHRDAFPADTLPVAEKSVHFLATMAAEGADLAGGLGSRGTEHCFPYGIEYFARHIDAAASLAGMMRANLERGLLRTPATVDDRYLAYFYLPHFVLACSIDRAETTEIARSEGNQRPSQAGVTVLGQSGLVVWRANADISIWSLRRRGAFSLIRAGRRLRRDMGYWAETTAGDRWSSSRWRTGTYEAESLDDGRGWRVRGRFSRVADKLPLASGSVLFHLLTDWLLRWPAAAEWMQRTIKRRKIVQSHEKPLAFVRELRWETTTLHVTDRLRRQPGCPPLRAVYPVSDIDVHSPSARTESPAEIARARVSRAEAQRWAAVLNAGEELVIESCYRDAGDDTHRTPGAPAVVTDDSDRNESDAHIDSNEPALKGTSRRWAWRLLGPALFVGVLTQIDLPQVWQTVRGIPVVNVLGAGLLCLLVVLIKGLRWNRLLRHLGMRESLGTSELVYGEAMFWGTLTPGRVGEFQKIRHLRGAHDVSWVRGAWYNAADRLFDLMALIALGLTAVLGLPATDLGVTHPLVWVIPAAIGLAFVATRHHLADTVSRWHERYPRPSLRAIGSALQDLAGIPTPTVAGLFLLSLLSLLMYAGMIWLLALGLPFSLSPARIVVCLTASMMVGMLPVSVFNLGTRELVLVGLFASFGLTAEDAVSFGMLFVICYLLLMGVSFPFERMSRMNGESSRRNKREWSPQSSL